MCTQVQCLSQYREKNWHSTHRGHHTTAVPGGGLDMGGGEEEEGGWNMAIRCTCTWDLATEQPRKDRSGDVQPMKPGRPVQSICTEEAGAEATEKPARKQTPEAHLETLMVEDIAIYQLTRISIIRVTGCSKSCYYPTG
jgi:hypothetical protein